MPKIKIRKGRGSPMVAHKDEKMRELRSRMNWLLAFLNKDIEALDPVELYRCFADFLLFLTRYPPLKSSQKIGYPPESDLITQRRSLKRSQSELRGMLTEFLKTAETAGEESFGESPKGFDSYNVHYEIVVTKQRIGKFRPWFSYKTIEDTHIIDKGSLIDCLIDTLNPFPLSRVKRCQKPDCGNYFYQKTTKSKGDFCSPRCQNWARTNRWRKANPDKYNAYHRNRRARAKEDLVEVKCSSCEFQQSIGSIKDLIQGVLSDIKKCPACGAVLLHIIRTWENGKWVKGAPLGSFEWEEFIRNETQKGEG